MADSETDTREAAAELRITRVKALSSKDLVAVVTYLLARYPDTFPPLPEAGQLTGSAQEVAGTAMSKNAAAFFDRTASRSSALRTPSRPSRASLP